LTLWLGIPILKIVTELDLNKLHTNQRLFVQELTSRGASVSAIDYGMELLEVHYDSKKEYLIDRTSHIVSYVPAILSADKHLTKDILNIAKISIPKGRLFSLDDIDDAIDFAESLNYAVVFKPNQGSHGLFVHSDIHNELDLKEAICTYFEQSDEDSLFLIEEYITGLENRIFITSKDDYAVLQREPAHVIGDGSHTIQELATTETDYQKKVKGSALCPIVIDETVGKFLSRQGKTLETVPKKDEKIYLRLTSNLALGGISTDMTDVAHPSAIKIAQQALACFEGLPIIGVDFITPDITKDQNKTKYGIIEVNVNPGLSMHTMPAIGKAQPVPKYLADVMFPDL